MATTLDNIQTVESIELPLSNPYANGRVIVFADGSAKLVRDRIEYVSKEPDDWYTVKHGDRLTSIAYRFYKDKVQLPSHYWWIIADVNKIRNPLDISAYIGKDILIPNILNFKLTN